jgi:uncharacterized membrane-anchored protein YhcB (DUF1043 family)
MNEDIVASVAEYTRFTPWEIVLMATVAGIFLVVMRMHREAIKLHRESLEAMHNSTNAINNNTTVMKEFKTDIIDRIKEIKE